MDTPLELVENNPCILTKHHKHTHILVKNTNYGYIHV